MNIKISVITPTYNEKENIEELLDNICKTLSGNDFEIIVVDDNSPDMTWQVVKRYPNKRVKLLRRPGKLGLASAVIDGFKKAKGDILIVIDADLSHDHKIIPALVKKIKEGSEISIGSRFIPGGGTVGWPVYRTLISKTGSFTAKLLLKVNATDPMSGFFAIKKSVFKRAEPKLNPKGYKILLELLVQSRAKNVSEVPYVFKDRKCGKSKLSGKIISEYLGMVFSLLKNR